MPEQFSERLRRMRRRKGVSQEVLADFCSLDRRTVIRYECGEQEPTMLSLIALADYFEVSMDYLSGRVENP